MSVSQCIKFGTKCLSVNTFLQVFLRNEVLCDYQPVKQNKMFHTFIIIMSSVKHRCFTPHRIVRGTRIRRFFEQEGVYIGDK